MSLVGRACAFIIGFSLALFGSVTVGLTQDRFGSAIDVFLEDEMVVACEYEVEIVPSARTRREYLARSLAFMAKMLESPAFLGPRDVLPADPFTLQVGTVLYDTTTRFRVTANRKCSDELRANVARIVAKNLPGKDLQLKLAGRQGPKRFVVAPSVEEIDAMDIRKFYQFRKNPFSLSQCTGTIQSQTLARQASNAHVLLNLTGMQEKLTMKYRHPIFMSFFNEDRQYVLLQDHCDSIRSVIAAFLESARQEGLRLPRDWTIGPAEFTDKEVDRFFFGLK
jgi:hypothetical protein